MAQRRLSRELSGTDIHQQKGLIMPWTFESTENFVYRGKPWRAWKCLAPAEHYLINALSQYRGTILNKEDYERQIAALKIRPVFVDWKEVPYEFGGKGD